MIISDAATGRKLNIKYKINNEKLKKTEEKERNGAIYRTLLNCVKNVIKHGQDGRGTIYLIFHNKY